MKAVPMQVTLKVRFALSFWDVVKLRIAGKQVREKLLQSLDFAVSKAATEEERRPHDYTNNEVGGV